MPHGEPVAAAGCMDEAKSHKGGWCGCQSAVLDAGTLQCVTSYMTPYPYGQGATAIQALCQHTQEGESRLSAGTRPLPYIIQVACARCMLHNRPQAMLQHARNRLCVPALTVKHGAQIARRSSAARNRAQDGHCQHADAVWCAMRNHSTSPSTPSWAHAPLCDMHDRECTPVPQVRSDAPVSALATARGRHAHTRIHADVAVTAREATDNMYIVPPGRTVGMR